MFITKDYDPECYIKKRDHGCYKLIIHRIANYTPLENKKDKIYMGEEMMNEFVSFFLTKDSDFAGFGDDWGMEVF